MVLEIFKYFIIQILLHIKFKSNEKIVVNSDQNRGYQFYPKDIQQNRYSMGCDFTTRYHIGEQINNIFVKQRGKDIQNTNNNSDSQRE